MKKVEKVTRDKLQEAWIEGGSYRAMAGGAKGLSHALLCPRQNIAAGAHRATN